MRPVSAAEWETVREMARALVCERRAVGFPGLRLVRLDAAAAAASSAWAGRRYPHWDWSRMPKSRGPDRFEVALWVEDDLCGLATGPSSARAVEIDRLEGNPDRSHPLRNHVSAIAVDCLELFGRALAVSEARIAWPASGMLARYSALGYRRREFSGYGIAYVAKML